MSTKLSSSIIFFQVSEKTFEWMIFSFSLKTKEKVTQRPENCVLKEEKLQNVLFWEKRSLDFLTESSRGSIIPDIEQFPNMVGRTTSLLQVSSGIGLMFGPSIGSLLYMWKGYLAPFLMAGVMETLLGVASIVFLPQLGEKTEVSFLEAYKIY